MWHVGIDLHRETVMIAAVNDTGEVIKPVRICCARHRCHRGRGQGVGTVSGGDRGQRNLSLAIRSAPSARHDPLGPSVSSAGYDTTTLEDRQARRPIVGQSAADQPDSAGLHSAGTLSAVARPGALPARGWAANWPRRKSTCGPCWPGKIGKRLIACPSAFAAWPGFVAKTSAGSKIWSAMNCWRG